MIARTVPAIVNEETWDAAQEVRRQPDYAKRNGRAPFLLAD